ncbi:MAG: DUF4230 domain-containing protein [Verrucomicrobia bacterium]|nr:DUF4230 domain-containing protein [Verrucomicrobiota bacterium]
MEPAAPEEPSPASASPAPRRGRLGFAAAFLGSVITMAAVVLYALWRAERVATTVVTQPSEIASRAAKAFAEVLQMQPQVTINERVVLNQSSPTFELAVLQREVEVEREFEHSWMGSLKRIRLRGSFRVKAGFDLNQPYSVALTDAPGVPVRIELPAPRILSVESLGVEILAYENGLWNKISTKILSAEIDALPDEARRKAFRAGLTREAEQAILQQLSARFPQPPGVQIKIVPVAPRDAPATIREQP